ncbi:hypothetical protein R1sor_011522 [Riccia sorocarpa]|uniref:Uncharacterized protein n=1 Tax=Riccia sorocarpa TaxID=122646 RepID=A0ABD3I279_9MARC
MEVICAGVPFITWPLNADQPLNARFVTEAVKVSIPIRGTRICYGGHSSYETLHSFLREITSLSSQLR